MLIEWVILAAKKLIQNAWKKKQGKTFTVDQSPEPAIFFKC
jgi:hypothetical protein